MIKVFLLDLICLKENRIKNNGLQWVTYVNKKNL